MPKNRQVIVFLREATGDLLGTSKRENKIHALHTYTREAKKENLCRYNNE